MSGTRTVYLSMLITTDQVPEDVQLAVPAMLSDRYRINNLTVHAPSDDETTTVTFVICPLRGLLRTFVGDDEAAEKLAKAEGAVTVGWTADADYRGEVTV